MKEKFPATVLLFVMPPSAKVLKERLKGRGTETEEVIVSRMKRACEEAEGMDRYDYLVINDELSACVEEVHQIIKSEHKKSFRNQELIEKIREELIELNR